MNDTRTINGVIYTIFKPGFVNPKPDRKLSEQPATWQLFLGPHGYFRLILSCPRCGRIEDLTGYPVIALYETLMTEGENGPDSAINCDHCAYEYWCILEGWNDKGLSQLGKVVDREFWEKL